MITKVRQFVLQCSKCRAIAALNRFVNSGWYVAFIALVAFAAQAFSLDVAGFSVMALCFIYTCVFAPSSNGCVAPLVFATYCVSANKTPWAFVSQYQVKGIGNVENLGIGEYSHFYETHAFTVFVVVGASLAVLAALFRLVFFGDFKRIFAPKTLLWGVVALFVAYALAGAGNAAYGLADATASAVWSITILSAFVFFAATLDFDEFGVERLSEILIALSLFMTALVGYIYITRYPIMLDSYGSLWLAKPQVLAGWGMSNDIGILIACCVPAYFVKLKKRLAPIWFTLACVSLVSVFFTYCRTGLLVGVIAFVGSFIVAVSDSKTRLTALVGSSVFVAVIGLAVALVFASGTTNMVFEYYIDRMDVDFTTGRIDIWRRFFEYFLAHPVFGAGFNADAGARENASGIFDVYAVLAHSTPVQMLGSCGVVGAAAWLYHTFTTVRLFCSKNAKRIAFFGIATLSYVLAGMLDTVFFKPYFVFVYVLVLATSFYAKTKQSDITTEGEKMTEEKCNV